MKRRNRINVGKRSGWAVFVLFVVGLLLWGKAAGAQSGVRACGQNDFGQLGIGTADYDPHPDPLAVSGFTGFTAIDAGFWYSLALKSDGTVRAWGRNDYGQLGDGTTTDRYTPMAVSGLTGVIAVAAGAYHSLAVKSDGTVRAWGRNDYGQLGDGTTTDRYTPMAVSGLTGVIAVAAGYYHSLALKSDGTIRAWGRNEYGQLGDGTTIQRFTPVQVSGLTGVVAMSGGEAHSLALKSDGTVQAWGWNWAGQLGDGTMTDRYTSAQVSGLAGVVSITGGGNHSLALKSDGTVWAWGWDAYGQLGIGYTDEDPHPTPAPVSGLTGVTAISGGSVHSLAIKSNGTVWAWGENEGGKLGIGTDDVYSHPVPLAVSRLTGVVAIAAGLSHSLWLGGNVTEAHSGVRAWGSNGYGQLGDGTTIERHTSVAVSGLTGVTAISAGGYHSLTLKSDGTIWAWGHNQYGQLGDGTFNQFPPFGESTPVQVRGLTGVVSIAAAAAYYAHSLAVKFDGTVWAWGYNAYGQLGIGSADGDPHPTPVVVSGLTGVIAVAAGYHHSLALKSNGTVWAWGQNGSGQLGDGTTTNRFTPVPVSGLTGVTAISAGSIHSLALKSDGSVWAWGINLYGQLGDGTTTDRSTPVQVHGPNNIGFLTGVVGIDVGTVHNLAVKSDGTVWAWGVNYSGQLGIGSADDDPHPTPVFVSGLTGVTAISAGISHSLALKSNGTVWAWGWNNFGQLGDGTFTKRYTPTQVHGPNNIGFQTGVIAIEAGWEYSLALTGWRLAWQNTQNGDLSYWLMNWTNATRTSTIARSIPTVWNLIGALDLNADGWNDFLWHNTSTGDVSYWLMNGTTRTATSGYIVRNVPLAWRPVALADLNSDGKKDLIWQNITTGDVSYWLMDGTRVTSTGYLARAVPTIWQITAALDLNNDGSPDLLWRNTSTGDLTYWLMNGLLGVSETGYLQKKVPLAWRLATVADMDGDAKSELIWQNSTTGDVVYWLLNGTSVSSTGYLARAVPTLWQIRTGF